MKHARGDLWDYRPADVIAIPTNGDVDSNGLAVMGAGLAKEAAYRFPGLKRHLGRQLDRHGNHVCEVHTFLADDQFIRLVTFPTKHHWQDKADIDLILRSADELIEYTDMEWFAHVSLPRVGCGLGGLQWDVVRPLLEGLLDDRFTVVSPG